VTEQEWLGCIRPDPMLSWVGSITTERKLRLHRVACCRREWELLDDEVRRAIELAEGFADSPLLQGNCSDVGEMMRWAPDLMNATWLDWNEAPSLVTDLHWPPEPMTASPADLALDAALLRDIHGNPFRPAIRSSEMAFFEVEEDGNEPHPFVIFRESWAEWNGGLARHLAQGMYDERRFDDMPILADILEEAGCTEEAILSHCRGPGPHVRGCWVLDLILGKE
jgi:hypothetical protein